MARTTYVRGEKDIRKEEWIARDSKVARGETVRTARVGKTAVKKGARVLVWGCGMCNRAVSRDRSLEVSRDPI